MDIKKLDELRLKLRNRYIVTIAVFILTVLYAILVNIIFIPLFIVVSLVLGFFLTNKLNKEYQYQFKKYFVKSSLMKTFDELIYLPSGTLDKNILASTDMIDTGDKYFSNDYVSGKYKNINFVQADVTIQERRERTDSNGHREYYYVNIFKGKWMIFDFNKQFKSDMQVKQKNFPNARLNRFRQKFEKVELEDVEFNKKFKVYSGNAHEVFYILTPHVIQSIKNLEEKLDGHLLFCFVDSKLFIGIDNDKDAFEPKSVFKKLNEEKIFEDVKKDIEIITMFVDELNLDNNLFRKVV